MNKTNAQEYAAELLEAAADGEWAELLGTGLNAETIEAVRELNQLNLQIERSEERERVMHQALVGRLQLLDFDDDPTTDGGDGPAPSATKPQQQTPPKPAGFDLSDLGVPQQRNVA